MSMKSATAPRRIYSRNDIVHVCFDGRTYGAPANSKLSLDFPVTIEKAKSDGGRAKAHVTQSRPGVKAVTETWRSIVVPQKPRG
jgi:hypothetical protein